MSWVNGGCQGDRAWECYYADWHDPSITWCIDSDEMCPQANNGGALINAVRTGGGGGWAGGSGFSE